jgi:hypothetical protein
MDQVLKSVKYLSGESDVPPGGAPGGTLGGDQSMRTMAIMTGEHGQMLTAAVVDVAQWVEENVPLVVTQTNSAAPQT